MALLLPLKMRLMALMTAPGITGMEVNCRGGRAGPGRARRWMRGGIDEGAWATIQRKHSTAQLHC